MRYRLPSIVIVFTVAISPSGLTAIQGSLVCQLDFDDLAIPFVDALSGPPLRRFAACLKQQRSWLAVPHACDIGMILANSNGLPRLTKNGFIYASRSASSSWSVNSSSQGVQSQPSSVEAVAPG